VGFDSGFDVPLSNYDHRRRAIEKMVAEAISKREVVDEQDKNGKPTKTHIAENCNQEPTTIEIYRMMKLGWTDGFVARNKAIEYRKSLNGGSFPVPTTIVAQIVRESYDEVYPPNAETREDILARFRNWGKA